jgi:DNA modification methylase
MKPKDLMMIPARVALALQADGWFLRSDIIWHKPNPMPESVTDRPTSSYEHVFLLTKQARYFYDAEAVREPDTGQDHRRGVVEAIDTSDGHLGPHKGIRTADGRNGTGRNLRNVWTIATAPFPEAHFATFPPLLAERCIKAGSKIGDTILDPFAGAFTTALAADRLGRNSVGIELNPGYCAMAQARIERDAGMFAEVAAQ